MTLSLVVAPVGIVMAPNSVKVTFPGGVNLLLSIDHELQSYSTFLSGSKLSFGLVAPPVA